MFEKEAKEWLDERYLKDMGVRKPCKRAYLAGAEPREKRIAELEAQIEKLKLLLNEIYSEYGFSELVKIRNDLPLEIQEVIKEIKGND